MNPVMVPGPPSPPPPQPPGPTPPPRPPGPGRVGLALVAVSAALAVLSTAVILTPLAIKVWTTAWIPASDRVHYGEFLVPALALAGLALYALASLLFTPGRSTAVAGPRGTAADGTDIASQRAGRRQEEAVGRHVTPGGTQ